MVGTDYAQGDGVSQPVGSLSQSFVRQSPSRAYSESVLRTL